LKSTIHVVTPVTTADFHCGGEEFRQSERPDLDVPIIVAMPLTIRVADTLVKCGLRRGKRVHPFPNEKDIAGYKIGDIWQSGVAARSRPNAA
jgi:hypothetical protein